MATTGQGAGGNAMALFRQLMSNSKSRSSGGCWTCRVRRKKCAENKPECDTCKVLEITCYFGEDKPDWMDGGPKQKEMAERIKSQVKKQASQRRDRKYLEMLEAGTQMVSISDDGVNDTPSSSDVNNHNASFAKEQQQQQHHHHHQQLGPPSGASDSDRSPPRSHGMGSSPESSHTLNGSSGTHASHTPPSEVPWHKQVFARQEEEEEDDEGQPDSELHFLMIYLDYVFPYLFPHYRPPVLAGGRGWILDVLRSNKALYHTTLSLSSSFFAVVLANGDKAHEQCTNRMVRKLETQLELGLKELQKEMCILNGCKAIPGAGDGANREKRLVIMQSIIQMLFFEVATCNKDNWKMHLDAAIALFVQILPDPDEWTPSLRNLYSPRWPPPEIGLRRPWSTSQAALRFFTASLLYVDVLASVTLGDAPRLVRYQPPVMPACEKFPSSPAPQPAGPLDLEEFFGLPNWMVQVLGDVAALESWKRVQMQMGTLDACELAARGKVLSDAMLAVLQGLETHPQMRDGSQHSFALLVADPVTAMDPDDQPRYKAMWLLSALSYLNVVLYGWRPESPEIRWSVAKVTELLAQVPKGIWLRALAWPMCVSGCLSPQDDENTYREIAARLGSLQVFGTIKEAVEVMEAVWARRDMIDESWTVSKCLNILGHGVLLI